jgi:hypothetical protein
MFEEPAKNAADSNSITYSANSGLQSADTANDEIDLYTGL